MRAAATRSVSLGTGSVDQNALDVVLQARSTCAFGKLPKKSAGDGVNDTAGPDAEARHLILRHDHRPSSDAPASANDSANDSANADASAVTDA